MNQPEIINIDSLDKFVKALQMWHSNKVALVKHMKDIPTGTEVSSDNSPEVFTLEGDMLKGFILGLDVALSELGKLPFEAEVSFTEEEVVH